MRTMPIVHAGWAMVNGIPMCGIKNPGRKLTLSHEEVTCLRCLNRLYTEACAELGHRQEKVREQTQEVNRLELQMSKVAS